MQRQSESPEEKEIARRINVLSKNPDYSQEVTREQWSAAEKFLRAQGERALPQVCDYYGRTTDSDTCVFAFARVLGDIAANGSEEAADQVVDLGLSLITGDFHDEPKGQNILQSVLMECKDPDRRRHLIARMRAAKNSDEPVSETRESLVSYVVGSEAMHPGGGEEDLNTLFENLESPDSNIHGTAASQLAVRVGGELDEGNVSAARDMLERGTPTLLKIIGQSAHVRAQLTLAHGMGFYDEMGLSIERMNDPDLKIRATDALVSETAKAVRADESLSDAGVRALSFAVAGRVEGLPKLLARRILLELEEEDPEFFAQCLYNINTPQLVRNGLSADQYEITVLTSIIGFKGDEPLTEILNAGESEPAVKCLRRLALIGSVAYETYTKISERVDLEESGILRERLLGGEVDQYLAKARESGDPTVDQQVAEVRHALQLLKDA